MTISGHTNVLSNRFGRGAADGVGALAGDFVVTTMPIPWRLAKERLGARPRAVHFVDSMEFDAVESQVAQLPPCDSVLAIGGGRAIDFGKYLAYRRGCRLISIPTVLSVDAFVTPKAGLRRNHRVEYIGQASPDPLVIDYDLLRTAPRELNIAGAGDLLSIHTATYDWELAQAAGKSEYPFSVHDVARARAILQSVRDRADAIRQCSDDGLASIVDGYMAVNTICLPADHYRVEEGSEHFLFYELEERLKRPFMHGQIVALGIYLMSHLQDNEPEMIVALMDQLGLDYRPRAMQIERGDLVASLMALKRYVRESKFWYTVIDEREITRPWADAICARLDS